MEHNRVMNQNKIVVMYRMMAAGYFVGAGIDEEKINELDPRIYEFTQNHEFTQSIEFELKQELEWLADNYPNKEQKKSRKNKIRKEIIQYLEAGFQIPDKILNEYHLLITP